MSTHDSVALDPEAVEAVCFDLDDTLFDFTQYVRAGLREAADRIEARTGEALHDELLALYFEEGVRERTFDHLLDRHDLDVPVDDLVDAYHDSTGDLAPYEDAEETLARLDDAYDLGLVTDGRNGRAKLRQLGIGDYFDAVVVAHAHGLAKREDPAVFRRALDALDAPPEAAVYVGDNPRTDFRVPNRLGMATVRLRRGRYDDLEPRHGEVPDAEIDALDALVPILAGAAPPER